MYAALLVVGCLFLPAIPTADQERAIAACLVKLESPRYAVREKAAKDLEAFGAVAKPALKQAFSHKDWEVRGRAETIFARIVTAEAESLYPMPFIDSFWWSLADGHYVTSAPFPEQVGLLDAVGRDGEPYRNYRVACDLWVKTRLADGANPKGLRLMLAELHRRDAAFIASRSGWPGAPTSIPVVDWREYLAQGK